MTDAYQQVLEHAACFDHSDRAKVVVAGPDARSFLHNLCTNDIKNLRPVSDWRQPAGGCEAFFATAQAKAVVFALIFCTEHDGQESFWLDLEPGLAEKVFRHLDRYIISEQVELADRSAEFSQWHIAGPEAESVLTRTALGPPCRIRRWDRLGLPGWDVVCPCADGKQVREQLTVAGAIPAGAEIFNTLRIEAGIPIYGTDIDDNRFVVEVGRTKQAISYTKGCYLGQEPIVMARDRGHVNRTLMGLRVHSPQALPAGTKLLRQGKEVGEVTSSVVSPRFGTIALAYIRRGNQEPGTMVEITSGGGAGAAEVVTLPFVR
jgi:tRNA-modifying protein YgfZ